jgi:hypothetical protein
MPYVTISLKDDNKKKFEDLCEEETRGKSNMFVLMLNFYLKNKDKVK